MIVKSRRIRKPISVVLMLALMLSVLCFGYKPLTVNSVEYFSFIVPGQTYYLKNVKSGKYLTVQHNVATEGQNIVQWHYTGFDGNVPNNNQKWRFVKKTISNVDYYQIVSVLDTSYAISLANSSLSTQAKLATVNSNDNKQLFSAYLLTNDAHRFFSKISNLNYALVVNGASVYDNTSIVQGQTGVQWSDQWLIEPVNNYKRSYGCDYGYKNCTHRLATYPDFDFYTSVTDTDPYESTNYASQCINFSGKNYQNDWKCMKLEHMQNQNFTTTTLQNYWNIVNKWYKPGAFYSKWQSQLTSNYISISEIMNYDSILLTQAINMGDCVQIIRIEPNADKVLLTLCICNLNININSNPYLFSPVNCRLATHTKDDVYYYEYLRDICSDYQTYYNADYVRFIHVE